MIWAPSLPPPPAEIWTLRFAKLFGFMYHSLGGG